MKGRKAWLIVLVVVVGALGFLFFARGRISEGVSGTRKETRLGRFELLDVTVAGEPFREGSPLQKVAEKINPFRGVKLGEFEIRRPTRHKDYSEAPMTAWVLYHGTNLAMARRPGASPPLFGSRVVVVDAAGKEYENVLGFVRRSTAGEMLISLPLVDFPREEAEFRLRFSPPPVVGREREWIEFQAKNPLHLMAVNWPTNGVPQTNEVNGVQIVLREVTLRPAACAFEVSAPNWSVDKCTMEDGNGNRHESTSGRTQTKPGQTFYWCGFKHSVKTNEAWRIEFSLVNVSDLPAEGRRILNLSSNAPPQSLTNQAGQVFVYAFDGSRISITGPAEGEFTRWGWIVVGATNAASGEALKVGRFAPGLPGLQGGSRAGQPFSQKWPALEEPCTEIVLEVGFPETLRTEFYLQGKDAAMPAAWTKR